MEYKGFKNKLSAIITAVSLVAVVVGTSVGSLNVKTSDVKGDIAYTQEASGSYEVDLVEATVTEETK